MAGIWARIIRVLVCLRRPVAMVPMPIMRGAVARYLLRNNILHRVILSRYVSSDYFRNSLCFVCIDPPKISLSRLDMVSPRLFEEFALSLTFVKGDSPSGTGVGFVLEQRQKAIKGPVLKTYY